MDNRLVICKRLFSSVHNKIVSIQESLLPWVRRADRLAWPHASASPKSLLLYKDAVWASTTGYTLPPPRRAPPLPRLPAPAWNQPSRPAHARESRSLHHVGPSPHPRAPSNLDAPFIDGTHGPPCLATRLRRPCLALFLPMPPLLATPAHNAAIFFPARAHRW
jgi:hypothetical protein